MSRSYRKPYDAVTKYSNKTQKAFRNISRKLIRSKSKRNVKALVDNPDLPYEGVSFKDGIDEWGFPSDGHQRYIPKVNDIPPKPWMTEKRWEDYKKYREQITRK